MANRTIKIYKDYFNEFYVAQTDAVRRKINYCLNVVRSVDRVPKTILRSMENTDGLYEIRVEVGSNIFRIFCCFDEGFIGDSVQWIPKENTKDATVTVGASKKDYERIF